MTKAQKAKLEADLTMLVEHRRRLGSFDANADAILSLAEAILFILKSMPKPKK